MDPEERDVLVVGEALVDVVTGVDGETVERPGGSAANVAVALARLGHRVRFATAYAADDRGRVLADHLTGAGVVLATDPHVVGRTSSAQATIAADGSASYVFDLEWRLGPVDVADAAVVHVCSLGAVVVPGADDVLALLDRAVACGALVSYDVNVRPAITGTGPDLVARVEAVAALAHLVKASDEDLAALYPTLGVDEAAAHLRTLGPSVVVVTRGADGATWHGWERVDRPVVPAAVVDTIGAGDTFSAGIIDALRERAAADDPAPLVPPAPPITLLEATDPGRVLDLGRQAAAITVSRPGADPPTRAELDATMGRGPAREVSD